MVTSINKLGVKEIGDILLAFIPASVYAYNIGENTLKMKTKYFI